MSEPMKVVIFGGVAAAPKVACRISPLMPDAEISVLEKCQFLSYAGCGAVELIRSRVFLAALSARCLTTALPGRGRARQPPAS